MSIVVEEYSKCYGSVVAVRGLSFQVEPGEVLGLIGPNGAGKTTTLRALAGILRPTRGRLIIAGHDVEREPVAAKKATAYIPDEPKLFDQLTVWEHLRFVASAYGLHGWNDLAESLLEQFELGYKRHALAGELSRGMRQKVAICCGYLHRPRAVLLDEPMTGLDPRGIRTMKEAILQQAQRGAAFIISSHLLSVVEGLCTSVLIMVRGRPVRIGKIADLRRQLLENEREESLEELFFRLIDAPANATALESAVGGIE
ncbi:MAG TPA: ABC transporter ATP-binding protein [Isosphaeraceae bacterium]|nr:ABC transporter ATP-binding protein [Isosphaeraceae bacterium]